MKQLIYILAFFGSILAFAQNDQLFDEANALYNDANQVSPVARGPGGSGQHATGPPR